MSTTDAYTAGTLDADGSMGIYRFKGNSYLSVVIYIAGQDTMLMDWLVRNYEGTYGRSQRVYMWRPNDRTEFLQRVLPYLITKKEMAELILAWRQISKIASEATKLEYVERSKELNSRISSAYYVRQQASTESKGAE